jgi:N-hydroxyarylamine O-acetyltransferase
MYSALSNDELQQYFQRIGFTGTAGSDLATLKALHYLHPLAIAFENLDSWLGTPPLLGEGAVFAKLVGAQRGGYCFEHNQLFMRVLLTLGFDVQGLSARVIVPDATSPRTHMVLLTTLDEQRYLVDVGFGGMTMTIPCLLNEAGPQSNTHEPWQLQRLAQSFVLSAQVAGTWSPKYHFSLELQTPDDYAMSNWFVATHPQSRFVTNLIAARVDQDGRHALMNTRYMRHRLGQSSLQTDIQNPSDLLNLLRDQFRINTNDIAGLQQKAATLFE